MNPGGVEVGTLVLPRGADVVTWLWRGEETPREATLVPVGVSRGQSVGCR